MKILSLYFKNINSLEGESRIHFDRPPIADGGVFAITGPNGSGKSSVLDAITLGLYGETFRFDRPSEHVMTKGAADCFSEVGFSLGDDQYKATWSVSRQQGDDKGELLPAQMKLIKVNGSEQVLEQSLQKVRERMQELTGMDFHKFSKSMVLAQGDFAAFLNALDTERMDVLEKISGTDIYANYKKEAEDNYNQAQVRLQQLEQDLNAIPLLDAETKEARAHDLADFIDQTLELEAQLADIDALLQQARKQAEQQDKIEKLKKQQQKVEDEKSENQKKLQSIDRSQNLSGFESQLNQLDNKLESCQQSKKTLAAYRGELSLLQKQLQSSGVEQDSLVSHKSPSEQKASIGHLKLQLSELQFDLSKEASELKSFSQQMQERQEQLNSVNSWLQEHEADKALLNDLPAVMNLQAVKEQLSESSSQQNSYSKWSKATTDGIQKKKAAVVKLNQKVQELKNVIDKGEQALLTISGGHSLFDLQEMEAEQKERVANFLELYDLAAVNAKLGKTSLFGQLFSKSVTKEVQQLEKESELLRLEIGREQIIVKTLEQAVLNEALLQKMQADRKYLQDGKACPLCGALEHPYSKYVPAVSNSKSVLVSQRKKVKSLKAESDRLTKQIARVKIQAEKDDKKEGQLQVVRSQWNSLANRLNVLGDELDIDNLSFMKNKLKEERAELANNSRLLKQYIKQQAKIVQAQETIIANENGLKRVTEELEALNAEWNERPKDSVELENAYKSQQAEEKILAEKVAAQLKLLGEKMPAKGKAKALMDRLEFRKQTYQQKLESQKQLIEAVKQQEEKLTKVETKIAEINAVIKQCSDSIAQEEMAGLHLSLVEKQKLIADQEIIFTQQESERVNLESQLQDSVKESVGDIAQLRETLSLIKQKPELEKQVLMFDKTIKDIQSEQLLLQEQLENESVSAVAEDELLAKKKSLSQQLDIAKMDAKSLQSQLDKQENLTERYETVSAKLEGQKQIFEKAEEAKNLVSAQNSMTFRRKVQKEMAGKLLSHTNQVLEKISGRYYVRMAESEQGLALEIEDTKQHNIRRLPKTLSGGESFIVSLALALGLADMASSKHAVDSLFLDEGFGNLDADSLYLAMTTLESLKTHGKVVGVISHVEGVRKRIKTQVEMIKKPNGLSELKQVF